ncbi:MAG: 5-methyltetrahydropteroyltriglutamate--homocysteine methyltransferase [Candidatus Binatota bacterium]|jgi:5-methyltetrahydropteroyltriglutamate--homocysteine methyltransferase|nr:5-methyltetrahydropteroyltriglutamate--homocysteine methyltransferase [Candidatus Binatota bacterium]
MPAKYRADHIGSLLRPAELLQARSASVDKAQLHALEDKHILTVLERQRDLGFKIFTDGEFRRGNFMSDFNEAVEGIDEGVAVARTWQTGAGASPRPSMVPGTVVRKIKQTRRLTEHEFAFAQQHSPGDVKVTLPTANQFPAIYYKKGISDKVYPSHSAFLWDIVPVIKAEILALASEGAHYIQIDAPRYSYYIDPKWRSYVKTEMGLDPDQALDEAIRADNACLEGANRQGVILAIHLCRGNNRSQWYAEGGYDAIAEKLFGQLNVDAFLLEYESDRAGSFEPLRFVPRGKTVVLGLVSSKLSELESQDHLAKRVDEASRYVPLENLAISPQCGFASTMEGNLLTEDQQWQKLKLVVDTAVKVWGQA